MNAWVVSEVAKKGFPSPHGDFVFETWLVKVDVKADASSARFPSPHGDFVFEQAERARYRAETPLLVSVPSRGFCFRTIQG